MQLINRIQKLAYRDRSELMRKREKRSLVERKFVPSLQQNTIYYNPIQSNPVRPGGIYEIILFYALCVFVLRFAFVRNERTIIVIV